MKKLLAVLMALVLMLSMLTLMAGCGSNNDKLLGKWVMENDEYEFFCFFEDGVCFNGKELGLPGKTPSYRNEYKLSGDELILMNGEEEESCDIEIDDETLTIYGKDEVDESKIISVTMERCAEADGIRGVWIMLDSDGSNGEVWNFNKNYVEIEYCVNGYISTRDNGKYELSDDELTITIDGRKHKYDVTLHGDTMVLSRNNSKRYFACIYSEGRYK